MTRVAAVFIESAANVSVEHCVFTKIGGNALMVSGATTSIKIANNNVSFVGSSGITVLARRPPSLVGGPPEMLLTSRELNMSFNQVHHIGLRVAHSAAIMVGGAHNSSVIGNLVFGVPASGAAYVVRNALGASIGDAAPLICPLRSILIAAELPTAHSVELATSTAVSAPLTGFDVPLVAKFIGAPACDSSNYLGGGGTGRIDSPYAEPDPFTYTLCSGCCPVHANGAVMRVVERAAEPTHAQLLSLAVSSSVVSESLNQRRQAVVYPGQSLEVAAVSLACSGRLSMCSWASTWRHPTRCWSSRSRAHPGGSRRAAASSKTCSSRPRAPVRAASATTMSGATAVAQAEDSTRTSRPCGGARPRANPPTDTRSTWRRACALGRSRPGPTAARRGTV